MKKILLSTIVLVAFSLSIILFEISCKKTAAAQANYTLPVATTTKLGGVIPDGTSISVTSSGKISTIGTTPQESKILTEAADGGIQIVNYDGTGAQELSITLPAGYSVDTNDGLAISPDHQTIFFGVVPSVQIGGQILIYACNRDGSNPHKVSTGFGVVPF